MSFTVRVSTEKETQEMSLTRQEEELEQLAKELDFVHVKHLWIEHSGFDIEREGLLESTRFYTR